MSRSNPVRRSIAFTEGGAGVVAASRPPSRKKVGRRMLVGVLTALLAGPATASAAWTAPVDLSAAGEDAFTSAVAVDAAGDAAFAWHRANGAADLVEARTRSAGGVLGATQSLSDAAQSAFANQVAVDASGNAVLTWLRSTGGAAGDVPEARTMSAAGVLGPVLTLSAGWGDSPQVAVDAAGNAVFVWRSSVGLTGQIQARTLSAAGALGGVMGLSTAGQDALHPQVDMNAAGDAVLTWAQSDGADYRIRARALSPAGVVSPPRTLSRAGQSAFSPQVSVDVAGDAALTWYRFDGAGDARVQARGLSASGTLSSLRTLSDAGEGALFPQVDVDVAGNAVVTWYRSDGVDERVQARTLSTAGVLGAVLTLSDAGQNGLFPEVAVDPGGDAVLTWYRSDGADNRIQARTLSAAGALGATATLSDAGQDAFAPKLAVDPTGAALVTWQRSDGVNSRIQFAAGP